MTGALIGDIVGSIYEFNNCRSKDFPLFSPGCAFTDDSVMTAAVALACSEYIKAGHDVKMFCGSVQRCMRTLGRKYPDRGYGGRFFRWLFSDDPQAYGSFGNGSAMRVSPVGWTGKTLDEVLELAALSAMPTHDHPEGIKGARAAAACVFLARAGKSKDEIRKYVTDNFYSLDFTIDSIRPHYQSDVSCQGSVPQAIEAFLESADFEDCIRTAVSLGGDSDTIAAIAGGIAEAFFGVPESISASLHVFYDPEIFDPLNALSARLARDAE